MLTIDIVSFQQQGQERFERPSYVCQKVGKKLQREIHLITRKQSKMGIFVKAFVYFCVILFLAESAKSGVLEEQYAKLQVRINNNDNDYNHTLSWCY